MHEMKRMSIEECRNYINQNIIPNTRYKEIEHDTAGDIDQFNASRTREDLSPKPQPSFQENLFEGKRVIPPNKIWHKNRSLDSRAVADTFKYIFHKFKKGLFIRIANNKLQTFLPFKNVHYKNEFGHLLKVDPKWGSVQDFLEHISKLLGYRQSRQDIKPFDEWVANNSLIRYDHEVGGTIASTACNNKVILYDMFKTLCEEREVPDIEFFVNRRDFPQMKVDDTEPYNHIYGTKHHPLISHKYDKYAPILSGSSGKLYADIPFPTYEDWARAVYQSTGSVFPNACREYPSIKQTPWGNKIEKAVFRGATTGSGVTAATNQRLKAFEMGQGGGRNLLDVGISKWNLRSRKLEGSKYLQTIERGKGNYPKANRLNLQEQNSFKYILTLEGHVAAYRLSYELSSGSVVLLADSQWQMWYYPFLKAYEHYVPVKEDLSDLLSQIQWCKSNDAKCAEIADNARRFYNKYLGVKGIIDFLQKELWELSARTKPYAYLPDLTLLAIEDEETQLEKDLTFSNDVYKYDIPQSPRCIGKLDGSLNVMRSKKLNDLVWEGHIFKNVNGSIDKFKTNNISVVGKRANHRGKTLEHIHESYIGIKAINKLVSRIPNFVYVFGPLQDARDMVFVEYIEGMSMMNWLKSKNYNFKEFLSILVQTNLAVSMAQNMVGFIHYDLYPWNVMIQGANDIRYYEKKFTYFLNSQGKTNMVTMKPSVVPVIIDYGKSRAIVYEPKHGTIDHGFSNLYQHNSIIDSLTLLYGSLNVLKDANKLGPSEMKLLEFPERLGLESHMDTKRWGKFGALFSFKPKVKTGGNAVPKNFVDFIMATFKTDKPSLQVAPTLSYPMEKGVNPIAAAGFMKHGNRDSALHEVVKHVDRSRPPQSDDLFFQIVIKNMLARRMGWVDEEIASEQTPWKIKEQWTTVKRVFEIKQRVLSKMPEMDFPKPAAVWLDDEMTPGYVLKQKAERIPPEDWMMTWILCMEAFLFGLVTNEGDYGQFIGLDGFLYHNAIASNNTLLKLRDMLVLSVKG